MTALIIDGKLRAARLRNDIAQFVTGVRSSGTSVPGLSVVLVGDDPASQVYVRSKLHATQEVGITSRSHILPPTVTQQDLLDLIASLNADPQIHGILVQLPLPAHIDKTAVINAIAPEKDVDGFHIQNIGSLSTGLRGMVPCTPRGCLLLLREHLGELRGKVATIVGCSNIVGRPMAELLLQNDCSVMIAHKHSPNTREMVRQADIVVVAAGVPGLIRGDWINPGATVIDVGINRVPAAETGRTRLVGDVAFDEAQHVAGAITPVPGGVGPMTIACLLANTITAFCNQTGTMLPLDLAA